MSNPGISADEQYGVWMKVKPSPRSRHQKTEAEKKIAKTSNQLRPSEEETRKSSGSRFQVLQEIEPTDSKSSLPRNNTRNMLNQQWKKKITIETRLGNDSPLVPKDDVRRADPEEKETQGSGKLQIQRSDAEVADDGMEEENDTADMREEIDNAQMTQAGPGMCGPSRSIGRRMDQRRVIKKVSPKIQPSIVKKKNNARSHQVIFGSAITNGPLELEQLNEVASITNNRRKYTDPHSKADQAPLQMKDIQPTVHQDAANLNLGNEETNINNYGVHTVIEEDGKNEIDEGAAMDSSHSGQ